MTLKWPFSPETRNDGILISSATVLFGASLLAISLFFSSSTNDEGGTQIGRIKARGNAEQRHSRSLDWKKVGREGKIYERDLIFVGPNTKAAVLLNNRRRIELEENSLVQFDEVSEFSMGLTLVEGKAKLLTKESSVNISGSNAKINVKDKELTVVATNAESSVKISVAGQKLPVDASANGAVKLSIPPPPEAPILESRPADKSENGANTLDGGASYSSDISANIEAESPAQPADVATNEFVDDFEFDYSEPEEVKTTAAPVASATPVANNEAKTEITKLAEPEEELMISVNKVAVVRPVEPEAPRKVISRPAAFAVVDATPSPKPVEVAKNYSETSSSAPAGKATETKKTESNSAKATAQAPVQTTAPVDPQRTTSSVTPSAVPVATPVAILPTMNEREKLVAEMTNRLQATKAQVSDALLTDPRHAEMIERARAIVKRSLADRSQLQGVPIEMMRKLLVGDAGPILNDYDLKLITPLNKRIAIIKRPWIHFSWSRIPLSGVNYVIEISRTPQFEQFQTYETDGESVDLQFDEVGKYYWRVRAEHGDRRLQSAWGLVDCTLRPDPS